MKSVDEVLAMKQAGIPVDWAAMRADLVAEDLAEDPTEHGVVYVVTSSQMRERCKIGFAINLLERIKTLQIGCPVPLDLLQAWVSTRAEEHALHVLCDELCIHGEWFDGAAIPRVAQYFTDRGRDMLICGDAS